MNLEPAHSVKMVGTDINFFKPKMHSDSSKHLLVADNIHNEDTEDVIIEDSREVSPERQTLVVPVVEDL